MGIFGSILNKIFHRDAAPSTGSAGHDQVAANTTGSTTTSTSASGSSAGGTGSTVDVEAVLTDLASKSGQQLDWRRSIVDLMKLLNLDSSLTSRKELAHELGYTGDTSDSASMNIWLHKQVMRKLAENGGKVPEDLKS